MAAAGLNVTANPGAVGVAAAAAAEAPLSGAPRRLRIPSIGVDSPVVELGFTDKGEWELPNEEVGWYRHTAPPGAAGNAVLVGHLNSPWGLPRMFARLKDVRVGDVVEVESDVAGGGAAGPTQLLRYLVTETRLVPNTAVEIMDPTEDGRLTLFTCSGSWNVGTRDYSHRQVVIARPLEAAAASPAAGGAAAPAACATGG